MGDVLAEIERDDVAGWKEWLVVRRTDYGVSITVDYQNPKGVRGTWQDSGITVDTRNLDALIAALQEARP